MKMRIPILIIVFALTIGLAGCGTQGKPAPRSESTPTTASATRTPVVEKETPPLPGMTQEALTPAAAESAALTPDPNAVGEIVMIETPVVDLEAVKAVVMAAAPEVEEFGMSTNGRWSVSLAKYPCAQVANPEGKFSVERLEITDRMNQEAAPISEQVINCDGLGAAGYENLGWGIGGTKYFFFENAVGVPEGMPGEYMPPLMMFDALENTLTELGPGKPSADLSLIAYGDKEAPENINPRSLKIINWNGVVLYDLPLDLPATGSAYFTFAWAKGRNVLAMVETDCTQPDCKSKVSFVDPAWNLPKVLVSDFSPGLRRVSWLDGLTLHFLDEKGKGWLYSFATGEISESE